MFRVVCLILLISSLLLLYKGCKCYLDEIVVINEILKKEKNSNLLSTL